MWAWPPLPLSLIHILAREEDLVFLCGPYEGIDERALALIATDYLSAGDYVLTGGELPAMVMIDCIDVYKRQILYTIGNALAGVPSFIGALFM